MSEMRATRGGHPDSSLVCLPEASLPQQAGTKGYLGLSFPPHAFNSSTQVYVFFSPLRARSEISANHKGHKDTSLCNVIQLSKYLLG